MKVPSNTDGLHRKFTDVSAGMQNSCGVAVSYGGQANKMLCWGNSDTGQNSPTATETWQSSS